MLLAEVLAEERQYKMRQKHPTCIENMQGFKNEKNRMATFFFISNGRFKQRELALFQQVIETQI